MVSNVANVTACHVVYFILGSWKGLGARGQIAKQVLDSTRRSRLVRVPQHAGHNKYVAALGLSRADRNGLDLRNMNSVLLPDKSGGLPSERYAHAFRSIGIENGRGQGTIWIRV